MKLNKPIISICIIIILIVDLIFFSFLSIARKTNDKEFMEEIALKFDFKKYLLNNDNIRYSIDNYKYSNTVFNYIDDLKVTIVKKKVVNNLFEGKEKVLDKSLIVEILNNSVYEYEYRENVDVVYYVHDDIEYFSGYLESKFNNEYADVYNSLRSFSSGAIYFISIGVAVVLLGLIIIIERKQGLLIDSITLLLYSFFIYYFNKHFLEIGYRSLFKYFDNLELHLDDLYVICFIIGFILLLICIVDKIRKTLREKRINAYNGR